MRSCSSKRAFQTQFKASRIFNTIKLFLPILTVQRWDFPRKHEPAHKNPALVARLHELWEQNYTQKDMVDELQAEGYPISDRELIRLRLRLKLLLRESVPRPKNRQPVDGGIRKAKPKKKRPKVVPGNGLINQLTNSILADESSTSEEESAEEQEQEQEQAPEADTPDPSITPPAVPIALSAEELLEKQLRQQQLQIESDEKWRTRKRRRRTRGWAGLPADAPGEPPRFPSETTIDEAKAYLGLDNEVYRDVRERFLEICRENEVIKKTIAGPEKWAHIVQQLIRSNTHLSRAFEQEPDVLQSSEALFRPKGQRALSLDVICMDVTKRLRVMEKSMSLSEAKTLLCLNPERTRYVRAAFANKLIANNFTNKFWAGDELWRTLRQEWVNESEYLTRALAQGEADPEYSRKLRAVEVLARDVMKRQQQERIAKDPAKKKQAHTGPGPGPAPPVLTAPPYNPPPKGSQISGHGTTNASQSTYANVPNSSSSSPDLQIDPSLLLAASDAAFLPISNYQTTSHQYQDETQVHPHRMRPSQPSETSTAHYQQYYPASSSQLSTNAMPLPIYFRLHPQSLTSLPVKSVWLSILHTPTVSELSKLAMREHHGTVVHKLEGVITYRGGPGQENREVHVEVGNDEELGAYLGHVRGEGMGQGDVQGKATFVVLLGAT